MPMPLPMKHLSSWLKKDQNLLIVETDGFELKSFVVHHKQDKIHVKHYIAAHHANQMEAFNETMQALQSQGGAIPKNAILITPEVVPAILPLPIDQTSVGASDMNEVVRWELEPVFAQYFGTWALGSILIGRGHMSYQDVQEVLEQLRERRRPGAQNPLKQARQFGAIAIEHAYINQEQLNEAIKLQQYYRSEDEQVVCHWEFQDGIDSVNGDPLALVCGISQVQRLQWVQAFEQHNLHLKGLYPFVGCNVPSLMGTGTSALLEVNAGLISLTQASDKGIASLYTQVTDRQPPSVEVCATLCQDVLAKEVEQVWVCGRVGQEIDYCKDELAEQIGRKVNVLKLDLFSDALPKDLHAHSLASLVSAAKHSLALVPAHQAVCIPGSLPPLPLTQRVETWAAAAAVALVVGMGVTEWRSQTTLNQLQTYIDQKNTELASIQGEVERLNDLQKTTSVAKKNLTEIQSENALIRKQIRFYQDMLPLRSDFVKSFLGILGSAVTEQVVLDSVTEEGSGSLVIVAWSTEEEAAQSFGQRLTEQVARWQMRVVDLKTTVARGRLGLDGYKVNLKVIPKIGDV